MLILNIKWLTSDEFLSGLHLEAFVVVSQFAFESAAVLLFSFHP